MKTRFAAVRFKLFSCRQLIEHVVYRRGQFMCCGRENKSLPESTSAGRHDEHWCAGVSGKTIENLLTARKWTCAIDTLEGYHMLVEMPCDHVQGRGPARKNYALLSQILDDMCVWYLHQLAFLSPIGLVEHQT